VSHSICLGVRVTPFGTTVARFPPSRSTRSIEPSLARSLHHRGSTHVGLIYVAPGGVDRDPIGRHPEIGRQNMEVVAVGDIERRRDGLPMFKRRSLSGVITTHSSKARPPNRSCSTDIKPPPRAHDALPTCTSPLITATSFSSRSSESA